MKAKELRIGNCVNIGLKARNLRTDYDTITASGLMDLQTNKESSSFIYEPIPLTEEWLVKFRFERTSYGRVFKGFHLEASSRVLATDVLSGFSYEQVVDEKYLRILYVHQLQNIYFALTNEELIIK